MIKQENLSGLREGLHEQMAPRRVDPTPREPLPRGLVLDARFAVEKKIGEGTFST